jgi:hypothetical protein
MSNAIIGKRDGSETNVEDFFGFAVFVNMRPLGVALLVDALGHFQLQIVDFELIDDMKTLQIRRQSTRKSPTRSEHSEKITFEVD